MKRNPGFTIPFFFITILLNLFFTTERVCANDTGHYVLHPDSLNDEGRVVLNRHWLFKAGDSIGWRTIQYDDSKWIVLNEPLLVTHALVDSIWSGIGWFRLHFSADSSLVNKPFFINLWQSGASELFLNGELLYTFGEVSTDKQSEQPFIERNPKLFQIQNTGDQLLAIRYSNNRTARFLKQNWPVGFSLELAQNINHEVSNKLNYVRKSTTNQYIFSLLPLTLAFFHLFVYLFYRKFRENLFFAFCLISMGALSYGIFQAGHSTSAAIMMFIIQTRPILIITSMLFGLMTFYSLQFEKLPRESLFFVIPGILLIIYQLIFPGYINFKLSYIYIAILMVRIIASYFKKTDDNEDRGAWIIGIGFIILIIMVTHQALTDFGIINPVAGINISYIYGVLSLTFSMSIYLAYQFAVSQKNLTQQLVQIKDLSEKTLIQERIAKKKEIEQKLLEADNLRKTKELEEARKLQLSMLPQKIPNHENLKIAAKMITATEVGGDYYDFNISSNDTLTIALGDATGHGMQAGTMVTSIKSLFRAFAGELGILEFFHKCNRVIRDMHFGNLYMSMMLIRFNGNRVSISSAGMPPCLLYRAKEEKVEEIVIKGMPLGAPLDFPYEEKQFDLNDGDYILAVSDGLPEAFNDRNEQLEFQKIKDVLFTSSTETPTKLISRLIGLVDTWRAHREQGDDITIVAIKYIETLSSHD